MPTVYGGKLITPSPFININKEYANVGGRRVGSTFNLQLVGFIVAYMGSPDSDEDFTTVTALPDEVIAQDARLKSILRKQEAIRDIFKIEGQLLEITSWDGTTEVWKCNPRVKSINFDNAIWTEICQYTVDLECDYIQGLSSPGGDDDEEFAGYYIQDASEEWSLEFGDVPTTYRISHNISATGKRVYGDDGSLLNGNQAWQNAKNYVVNVLQTGINLSLFSQSVSGLGGHTGYNKSVTENFNEQAGTYSISENWLASPQNYTEEFTVTKRTSIEDGKTEVGISGTITGLGDTNHDYTNKYARANTAWSTISALLYTRASLYADGVTLTVGPVTNSVSRNPVTGVITYDYSYNNRPSNCISGALSENISITDNLGGSVVAVIGVLGRAAGPVLQDVGTVTQKTRSLTIEVRTTPIANCITIPTPPDVANVIVMATPGGTQVFKTEDTRSWNWKQGTYNVNITWLYQ